MLCLTRCSPRVGWSQKMSRCGGFSTTRVRTSGHTAGARENSPHPRSSRDRPKERPWRASGSGTVDSGSCALPRIGRRWKEVLPEPERSSESYQAFLETPLGTDTEPMYVVSSDVTACYELRRPWALGSRNLARTGDSDGVEALTSLLAGLMGRSYGLPQQSGSSDALANA